MAWAQTHFVMSIHDIIKESNEIQSQIKVLVCALTLYFQGSGGDGVADCQDDRQRCRSPVKPRQPWQVHQGIKPHSVVCFLCSDV